MNQPFIIYLKNKLTSRFEYSRNVKYVTLLNNGYRITFTNGRSYNYGADRVKYYPFLYSQNNVRIYVRGKLLSEYSTVDNYGAYLIFRHGNFSSSPFDKNNDIEICSIKQDVIKEKTVFDYFRQILQSIGETSFDIPTDENKNPNQISADILLKALDNIDLYESRSALSNYLAGKNPAVRTLYDTIIYPFGCNESQKKAVEASLRNSLSIIEGPPGTGKTQTILNIVANLIVQNKTVAIVSNNNSAVFNVRDKLEGLGYGIFVASLGNKENKETFFETLKEYPISDNFKISTKRLQDAEKNIIELNSILNLCFQNRNKLATLKTKLLDAEVEFGHLITEQPLNSKIKLDLDKKFYRKLDSNKALKLKYLLLKIEPDNKLSFITKLRLIFQYGLIDLNTLDEYSDELVTYVNHKFYELYIEDIKNDIQRIEEWLISHDEKENLNRFIEVSKDIFNVFLFRKYKQLAQISFGVNNYISQFDDFIKHYPVILSSTLSLHTSIPKGFLFDYLIIDESSQVDIIKSALCFSCSRNVVVVGDSMQLTHIVDEQSKATAEAFQKEYNISPAYDYVRHNILNSLKSLYAENIKSVLLKEHYRCHPIIIGFCNKKYYNNELVVMTGGDNHPFKIIETNIAGGRGNYNQRQIDETDFYIRENYFGKYDKVGIIAPYRNHANKLQQQLPEGAEADTIHKFQGREKDAIIFNTVKNNINQFIDNPNLINVAVSRAVKEFIVVMPESMELPHGTNIGDLIRYMYYTTNLNDTIVKGNISSVFDLLYKEYNRVFISFLSSNKNIGGSAAEIIMHKLLNEKILPNNPLYSSIDMVREYRLRDLVRNLQLFEDDVAQFIRRNSRIDFLLYNKIDKTPVLAIEVDGVSFHSNELQQERDRKKDYVLKTIGLPLLRLSTEGHNEEQRIIESLNEAMGLKN